MNIPEVHRCSYCGQGLVRSGERETEHILRKRNSKDLVTDSCADCNRKYLEQWDIAGQIPSGPLDSLLNMVRRSRLVAQRLGDTDTEEALKIFERYTVNTSQPKTSRKRLRVASESEDQEVITAIADLATMIRQFWEYLGPHINPEFSIDYTILSLYAKRVEKNPGLWLQWWDSTDHAAMVQNLGAFIQLASHYDMTYDMDGNTAIRFMFSPMVNEASVFLVWLRDRIRQPETVS